MTTLKAILVDDENSSITALNNLLNRFCAQLQLYPKG